MSWQTSNAAKFGILVVGAPEVFSFQRNLGRVIQEFFEGLALFAGLKAKTSTQRRKGSQRKNLPKVELILA